MAEKKGAAEAVTEVAQDQEMEALRREVARLEAELESKSQEAVAMAEGVRDEWQEMRTIRLMRPRDTNEKSRFVAVNGRSYQLPYGKTVEVPLPIYERLMICMEAEDMEDAVREDIPSEAAPTKV